MYAIRSGLVLMLTILLAECLCSCTLFSSLGYSGPKRYKTEMLASFAAIQKEIEKTGTVTDASVKKAQAILDKWKEEQSKNGSYLSGTKVMESIAKAKADVNKSFREYQNALVEINRMQEQLKTEVAD